MDPAVLTALADELEKIALRRGAKIIKSLVSKGTPAAMQQATSLAKTPGVLKQAPAGTHLKHLGRGGEGIADLVAHPRYGVSVRKLYDPRSGLASPTMIGRKMQVSREIESPQLAQTYGFQRSPSGGRMTFHEYSPPTPVDPGPAPNLILPHGRQHKALRRRVREKDLAKRVQKAQNIQARQESAALKEPLQAEGRRAGWDLADIRGANVSGGKAIDVLPFKPGELESQVENMLFLSPSGRKMLSRHTRKIPATEQMMSEKQLYRLLGGTSPARRSAVPELKGVARPLPNDPTVSTDIPMRSYGQTPREVLEDLMRVGGQAKEKMMGLGGRVRRRLQDLIPTLPG